MQKGIKTAKYLCLLPGVFLIVSGVLLLFVPNAAATLYDLPNAATLMEPIALAMGIRQLAIGLMIVTLALRNQLKALGYVMVIGAIVPLVDFMAFGPMIGWMSALRHAGPVPLIFGLGIFLLRWQKRDEL